MKKLFTLALSFAVSGVVVHAQAPAMQWETCLGGGYYDVGYSVYPTADGGYIAGGVSNSTDGQVSGNHGGNDYWLVKLDGGGSLQWAQSYGDTGDEELTRVIQTPDGGYIMAGYSNSNHGMVSGNHGDYDMWIVKVDGSGGLQWQKSIGGIGPDMAEDICSMGDGGYMIVGGSMSHDGDATANYGGFDYWLVRIDGSGNVLWQQNYGGSYDDIAYSGRPTSDGGFIIGGNSFSQDDQVTDNRGQNDMWVVKTDGSGAVQWKHSYGGIMSDALYQLQQTTDGGYVLGGFTSSTDYDVTSLHGSNDYWLVKLDTAGTIQWQRTYGGTQSDQAIGIQQTADGGYIMAGSSVSDNDDVSGHIGDLSTADFWVIKVNGSGEPVWNKDMGGTNQDAAQAMVLAPDGGCVVIGSTFSNDGDVSGNHGNEDFWIAKLASDEAVANTAVAPSISVGPNPTTSTINIQSSQPIVNELTDITGKIVIPSTSQTTLDLSSLSNGIYLLSVYDASGVKVKTEKVVKE